MTRFPLSYIPRFILHWLRGRKVQKAARMGRFIEGKWISPRPWTPAQRERLRIHVANTSNIRRLS